MVPVAIVAGRRGKSPLLAIICQCTLVFIFRLGRWGFCTAPCNLCSRGRIRTYRRPLTDEPRSANRWAAGSNAAYGNWRRSRLSDLFALLVSGRELKCSIPQLDRRAETDCIAS